MNDLVKFVRARLDEDEADAKAAPNRRWLVEDNTISLWPQEETDGFMSWPTRRDAHHAARWEPARVLREVEAKRRMLAEAECTFEQSAKYGHDYGIGLMETTLALLALPHADHPDYKPEWRL